VKSQPAGAKFKVHATDAPNVNGARDLGYRVGAGNDGEPAFDEIKTAVESGRIKALYVIDPGPEGSAGNLAWLVEARRRGTLPLLIVQAIVMSDLVQAADIVLPGASFVEKDAVYTNADGRVQAVSKAIAPPGEAREDWSILVGLARLLGLSMSYDSSAAVRRAIAEAHPDGPYAHLGEVVFARPVAASHWLQSSNPSERWKWDFMYQDLLPLKGHNVQMEGMPSDAQFIPLRPVE
jgi:anaerobic selenocysteine-containing dehydrogenase